MSYQAAQRCHYQSPDAPPPEKPPPPPEKPPPPENPPPPPSPRPIMLPSALPRMTPELLPHPLLLSARRERPPRAIMANTKIRKRSGSRPPNNPLSCCACF